MADRDAWEKAESLSKIFAAVFIPVVLGVAGLFANQALEKSKTRDELLKQAIDVVFLSKSDLMAGADKSFESRRAHRSRGCHRPTMRHCSPPHPVQAIGRPATRVGRRPGQHAPTHLADTRGSLEVAFRIQAPLGVPHYRSLF